ncbi:MAG: PASTA domain-containing protein [Bryobacterales bacterium]|nr:PASTA domain-containing protein [Bryobacterales bacterium]
MRSNPIKETARKRVGILAILLGVWVCAIIGRLVQVQLVRHEEYARYAASQQTQKVKLLAPRGAIYDRNGNPLALSLEQDSIAINPMRVPNPAEAARLLAGIFHLDERALAEKIARYKEQHWGFLWVRRWSTDEESKAAHALRKDKQVRADWIEFYKEHKRYYPKHELASHVLGSVGVEESGLFGIEFKMENVLSGRHGEATVLQDVRQRGIESLITTKPRPGSSIRISIDQRIQNAAETALKKAIHAAKLPSGNIVVMDPHTGDILAMASFPDFDPNIRPRTNAELEKRINRGMSLIYEPGSVFKVITLAAALERTRLRPASVIDCGNGSIRLPGRVVRDHHSYKSLSMEMVLAKSSNIGAINVANVVGKNVMYDYIRAFGFGERTGIELPFEEPGYVWPMQKIDTPRIYSNILASVAMGHQISTTTLQLAQACSVIANGGTLVKPRMLLETRSPDGVSKQAPVKRGKRVVRPETAITMRKMMETVILEGTGKGARLAGWTAGGKTGTAQIFDLDQRRYLHEYYSSFMGFAPIHNPAIVVVVTLDRSKAYGGTVAAPVFQEVAAECLRVLGVPMDNPATAIAQLKKPEPGETEEGDFALESGVLPVDAAKLLPDTRRQLVRMLADAIKTDPEIEAWMPPPDRASAPAGRPNPNGREQAGSTAGETVIAATAAPPSDELSPEKQFEEEARRYQRGAEMAGDAVPGRTVSLYLKRNSVPPFTGKSMREVMSEALKSGVEIQAYGRGMARAQIPPAGTELPEGEAVRVLFTP